MKERIALLTDSTCDIPTNILKEKNITTLPLKIIYSTEEFEDRVDITPQEVSNRFNKEIPTTSMPTPHEIKESLLRLKKKGFTHVIAIHISSGLSGTYNTVRIISNQINGLIVETIDSKALSMGLGRLVLYANDLIEARLNFKEIVEKIRKKTKDIEVFFVVKTLKYLTEGGRIGKVKGTIGELLNIKPIISINENGEYYTYKKTRGRKKSINNLYKIIKRKIKDGLSIVDVSHSNALKEAEYLLKKIEKLNNVNETSLGEISPGMIVHAGPGLIGVTITKLD